MVITGLDAGLSAGSKRELLRVERRAAIVAVAARLFLANGFTQTTMSSVAAEIGGSKGTLWSYFGSKEDLLAAVLDAEVAAFMATMSPILDPRREVGSALKSYVAGFIKELTKSRALALQRMIVSEAARTPALADLFYDRGPRSSQLLLAGYLAQKMRSGVLRQSDSDQAAAMLFNLLSGGVALRALWGVEKPKPEKIDEEARWIVDLFMQCHGPR